MFLGVPTLSIASIYGKQLNSTLDWNFAVDRQLADDITFTRASSGTYWDAAGVLQTQAVNLCLQSEDFDTTWAKVNSLTVTVNDSAAPDGSTTADKLHRDSAATSFRVQQTIAVVTGFQYTLSVYLRAAEVTWGFVRFLNQMPANSAASFNLTTGAKGTEQAGIDSATIEDVGGGWYRCAITATAATTGNTVAELWLGDGDDDVTFASGNTTDGFHAWGAQLETGPTATTYIKTTTAIASLPRFTHNATPEFTNLCLQSEDFGTTWANSRSTDAANTAISPDGTLTADSIIEDGTATNTHYMRQSFTKAGSALAYAVSVYAKASTRSNITIHVDDNAIDGGKVNFNLSAGTAGSVSMVNFTSGSASIENVGGGWYRCAFMFTTTTATGLNLDLRLHDGTSDSYSGDAASGLYIWGAQLQTGSVASAYLPTTTVAAHSARQSLGLLIEEARTNICLQSEDVETTWAVSGTPVITANSTVSPDGNTTADTVQDDDGAGYEYIVQTIAGISNSVTHTTSVFVLKDAVAKATRFPAFTLRYKTGGTTSDLRFGFDTSTGEVGTAVQSGTCTITGSGVIDAGDYWRFWVATTNDATGNTELEMRYYPAFGAGAGLTTASAAATGSNVVFGFQFELGSFPTSYIKTTTASVTRAADVATDTSIPWYNQSEGTVILEGSGPTDTTSTLYATFYESSSDYVSVQRNTTAARGQSNGVSIQGGTWATNIIGKVAIGYKLNDYAVAFDGALLGTDASGTPPTAATELRLSSTQTGTQKNGTISRIRYYAKRLPNTKLQALTGS